MMRCVCVYMIFFYVRTPHHQLFKEEKVVPTKLRLALFTSVKLRAGVSAKSLWMRRCFE